VAIPTLSFAAPLAVPAHATALRAQGGASPDGDIVEDATGLPADHASAALSGGTWLLQVAVFDPV
jgi:hypothetical protein